MAAQRWHGSGAATAANTTHKQLAVCLRGGGSHSLPSFLPSFPCLTHSPALSFCLSVERGVLLSSLPPDLNWRCQVRCSSDAKSQATNLRPLSAHFMIHSTTILQTLDSRQILSDSISSFPLRLNDSQYKHDCTLQEKPRSTFSVRPHFSAQRHPLILSKCVGKVHVKLTLTFEFEHVLRLFRH